MARKITEIQPEAYTDWMKALAARKSRRKLPKWLDAGAIAPPDDGSVALDPALTEALTVQLTTLGADAREDEVMAGLRGWATPESRDRYVASLLAAWKKDKYKTGGGWVLDAAGAVGHDGAAAALADLAVAFREDRRAPTRERALDVLPHIAAIGTDDALRALLMVPRRVVGLKVATDKAFMAAANARKVKAATLAEELLPLKEQLKIVDKPKSVPSFVKVKELPALKWADGTPLDATETKDVVRAIAAKSELMWEGLAVPLKAALDPECGEALASTLLKAWKTKDYHGSYEWVLRALSTFGGDRVALEMKAPLLEWSSRRASDTLRKRAINAMSLFEGIGTDTAVLVLMALAEKNTRPTVYWQSTGVLARIARGRGLTVGQLMDRVTPDCGLDEGGSRVFDYGPRQFTLIFDDDFRPRIRDSEGGVRTDLPAARQSDDASKVAAAGEAWALVKDQLGEILSTQTARLQQDMIAGRRWPIAEWREWLLGHPLMVNYTRRLVWGLYDGDGALTATFRVDEDGGLVDVEDEAVEAPEGTEVRLMHPALFSAGARKAWGESLADYEIITPFPQLERPTWAPTAEEAGQFQLLRFASLKLKAIHLYSVLTELVWDRDDAGFHRKYFAKRFEGARLVAFVNMEPGYHAGGAEWAGDQEVAIDFHVFDGHAAGRVTDKEGRIRLDQVDPVAFSEVMNDLQQVLEAQGLSMPS